MGGQIVGFLVLLWLVFTVFVIFFIFKILQFVITATNLYKTMIGNQESIISLLKQNSEGTVISGSIPQQSNVEYTGENVRISELPAKPTVDEVKQKEV